MSVEHPPEGRGGFKPGHWLHFLSTDLQGLRPFCPLNLLDRAITSDVVSVNSGILSGRLFKGKFFSGFVLP